MEGLPIILFLGVVGVAGVFERIYRKRRHKGVIASFNALGDLLAKEGQPLHLFEPVQVPIIQMQHENVQGPFSTQHNSGLARIRTDLIIHCATDFSLPVNWAYHQANALRNPTITKQSDWDPTCYRAWGTTAGRQVVFAQLRFKGWDQEAESRGTVLLLQTTLRKNLEFRPEQGEGLMRWLDGVGMPFDIRDEETGDRVFDRASYIQGPLNEWMARLNDETRLLLADFRGQLRQGYLVCLEPTIETDLPKLTALAEALELERPVAEALAHNAIKSEHPMIRRRCAELTMETFPTLESSRRMALELLQDDDPALRILVATAAGEPAIPIMLALCRALNGPAEQKAAAIAALATIGQVTPAIIDTLQQLISPVESSVVASAALSTMHTLKIKPEFERLERVIDQADGALGRALAKALIDSEDPRWEDAILRLLASPSDEVAMAAAQSLKPVGTAKSVHPLMQRDNSMMNFELKDTIRTTLAAIRNRVGVQETGQLSVADDASEGGLSVSKKDFD